MKPKKPKTVVFSTNLTKETKDLLKNFSKARGIKINHLIEDATLEYIEDEMDKILIKERESEETIKWKRNN